MTAQQIHLAKEELRLAYRIADGTRHLLAKEMGSHPLAYKALAPCDREVIRTMHRLNQRLRTLRHRGLA